MTDPEKKPSFIPVPTVSARLTRSQSIEAIELKKMDAQLRQENQELARAKALLQAEAAAPIKAETVPGI